jgi:hypothetical protein
MIPIAERILDCFPSGSYAVSALLRLLDIVESREIPTAAVECRVQPRLLINPDFVQRHANTPDKLLMLIMHELHHVLLGHTTLFKRLTTVDNFIFDAVINGLLCRMFPQAQHTSFFTDFYSSAFPECLLRPPAAWPGAYIVPAGIAGITDSETRGRVIAVHRGLYSESGVTYQEVAEVLPSILVEAGIGGVPLLGDHSVLGSADGQLDERSPVLFDVVRGIVEEWPQPPNPIAGRSLAEIIHATVIRHHPQPSARTVLRRLISSVATTGNRDGRHALTPTTRVVEQPIPVLDRRTMVQRALGFSPLLHRREIAIQRVLPSESRVHIYVDVSGSMDSIKDALYGAILECRDRVHPTVHLFSTAIADITLDELRRGVCRSTGGTSVACIAEHMAKHRISRAVIVTDGYTGTPSGAHRETLRRARLAVAYLGMSTTSHDLGAVADHSATISIGAAA